jgi:hypothetical protein
MERLFSAPVVVALWGGFNLLMVGLLAGFVASGFGGSMFVVEVYGAATGLVFLLALLVGLARRRRRQPLVIGLRVPPRPAVALMLALAAALLWLGLPFGMWVPMLAFLPLSSAVIMEIAARRATRG